MHHMPVALATIVPRIASMPTNSLNSSTYTSIDPKDLHQTLQIRLAALTCSTVSLTTSLVVLYWFCRMKKRFRHWLIIMLLYGDLMRTTWFFLFMVISFAKGTIKTRSAFCQSSGFLVQYGTETSDYAVLVIAVHSALQIFRPSTQATSDGLYLYRRYVYATALLLPILMSSLAFINSRSGYSSLGASCSLPIRPFWYRLALAWIPRYLIATIIVSLAIAIYAHVGFEFQSYSDTTQNMETSYTSASLQASRQDGHIETAMNMSGPMEQELYQQRRASSIAHDVLSSHRAMQSMSVSNEVPDPKHILLDLSRTTQTLTKNSKHYPQTLGHIARSPLSVILSSSSIQSQDPTIAISTIPDLHNSHPSDPSSPEDPGLHVNCPTPPSAQHDMALQRAHIHRQLRLMFIYPLAYTLMWLLPFVLHCMMYRDKYALRPLWMLRLGSTICITSMGFVDCLIFSMRETPWRSIPTSDGTFWGSFVFWRRYEFGACNGHLEAGLGESGDGVEGEKRGSVLRKSREMRRVTTSEGVNDYARMAASQARLRLQLEKEERVAALAARMASRRASVCERGGRDDSSGSHYSEEEGGILSTELKDTDNKRKGKFAEEMGESSTV